MIMHVRLDRLAFSLNRELEGRDAHARMNKEGIIERMCGETPHRERGATAAGARPAAFLLTSRA
jgi:hypothetical protein